MPPQVTLVTPAGPAGGYLPLSLFGIAPIAGVGDDTITNFNVPTFFYGGTLKFVIVSSPTPAIGAMPKSDSGR